MPYEAATVVMGDRFAHPRKQKIREHSNGFCMKLYAQRMDPIWNRVKIMYALIKLTSPGKAIKLNQQAWIIKPYWSKRVRTVFQTRRTDFIRDRLNCI